MNAVLENIYGRSSVRKYKREQVPDDDIKEILKAGSYAASGMNRQPLRFVVIQEEKMIECLNDKLKETHLKTASSEFRDRLSNPDYNIFHKAPALIFVFAAPDAVTAVEDGALAVSNMMLAACSMNYGTCFIGLATPLGNYDDFRKKCGVPEDHRYLSCMCLGTPDGVPEKHPKNDVKLLNWIR
jgi:Nitroreductase